MCVIIYREPNITIPFEKLRSACTVNEDGMGLVAFDRGKLELRKVFDKAGNSPDTLAKFLEDAKDLSVYVHLRYRTKGNTDKENVHPFGVLKQKKHGMDIQFMHNGTLVDFGTTDDCDSKHFAKTFLTPFSEKMMKAVDPEVLIHDKSYQAVLKSFAGRSSVFLLADSFGNHQIINYNNGKEFEGWWASNEYSFNSHHRTPTYNPGKTYYNSKDWSPKGNSPQTGQSPTLAKIPAPAAGRPFNDEVPFEGGAKKETEVKEVTKKVPVSPTLPKRERFIEVAEISSLEEVCQLSRMHIEDMVEEYPEQAVLLILDLLAELYDRQMEADDTLYEAA